MPDGSDERDRGEPTPPYSGRLRFDRDEVKHEFNLRAMRSNIFVTCFRAVAIPAVAFLVFWGAAFVGIVFRAVAGF